MCWGFTGSGIFSIKLIIWLICRIESVKIYGYNFIWIWKLEIVFEIKIFL